MAGGGLGLDPDAIKRDVVGTFVGVAETLGGLVGSIAIPLPIDALDPSLHALSLDAQLIAVSGQLGAMAVQVGLEGAAIDAFATKVQIIDDGALVMSAVVRAVRSDARSGRRDITQVTSRLERLEANAFLGAANFMKVQLPAAIRQGDKLENWAQKQYQRAKADVDYVSRIKNDAAQDWHEAQDAYDWIDKHGGHQLTGLAKRAWNLLEHSAEYKRYEKWMEQAEKKLKPFAASIEKHVKTIEDKAKKLKVIYDDAHAAVTAAVTLYDMFRAANRDLKTTRLKPGAIPTETHAVSLSAEMPVWPDPPLTLGLTTTATFTKYSDGSYDLTVDAKLRGAATLGSEKAGIEASAGIDVSAGCTWHFATKADAEAYLNRLELLAAIAELPAGPELEAALSLLRGKVNLTVVLPPREVHGSLGGDIQASVGSGPTGQFIASMSASGSADETITASEDLDNKITTLSVTFDAKVQASMSAEANPLARVGLAGSASGSAETSTSFSIAVDANGNATLSVTDDVTWDLHGAASGTLSLLGDHTTALDGATSGHIHAVTSVQLTHEQIEEVLKHPSEIGSILKSVGHTATTTRQVWTHSESDDSAGPIDETTTDETLVASDTYAGIGL